MGFARGKGFTPAPSVDKPKGTWKGGGGKKSLTATETTPTYSVS